MLKKNSVFEVEIENISGDGNGIAKIDSQVVFVPFTAIGDKVKILIIKVTKSYAVGKVLEILTPSLLRKESDCEFFGKCGGCAFRHISIEEENRVKTESVKSAMKRIGHLDVEVRNCITPEENQYRNKAQLPVSSDDNRLKCGYYASHSHRIVDKSYSCAINPPIFSRIAQYLISFFEKEGVTAYSETDGTGLVRHLYFRQSSKNKVFVCIVLTKKELVSTILEEKLVNELTSDFPMITSVFLNYNPENTNVIMGDEYRLLWGDELFEDELLDTRLVMSPDSFFQVNRKGAELIYSKAFNLLNGYYENVYDLYCGIGSIGLSLFNQIKKGKLDVSAKRLFGVEIVEKAIVCAKENAKLNSIDNAEFACSDSSDITKMDWFDTYPPSLVILDPPRKGTTVELLDFLADKGVPEILYISCDPATLARDMSYLVSKGYCPSAVQPVNLFTGTKHVENCVLLSREDK